MPISATSQLSLGGIPIAVSHAQDWLALADASSIGVMADDGDADEAEQHRREMAEDIHNQQALRRRGLPEEQAAAIAFLASDDASFITGQVINCSGGQS